MREDCPWRRKGYLILSVCCLFGAMAAFTPVGLAAPRAPMTPRVVECTTWHTLDTKNVSHTIGSITYTGAVRLQDLVAFPNDLTFCGYMRAVATFTTPLGADPNGWVQACLLYHLNPAASTCDPSTRHAQGGATVTSYAPSSSGKFSNTICGEAFGTYQWPDASQPITYNTPNWHGNCT